MDVTVTPNSGGKAWMLTDLLGRNMGSVKISKFGLFIIDPAGHAVETMAPLGSKSYDTLDATLAAIEEHTRGVCRHAT